MEHATMGGSKKITKKLAQQDSLHGEEKNRKPAPSAHARRGVKLHALHETEAALAP
jgi:hypothetical protein